MGLIAKQKSTGLLLNIFDFKEPRKEIDSKDIECHLCAGDLIIKSGMMRIKHFAHKPSAPCKSDYARHPESYEHIFFKNLLSKHLGEEFEEYMHAHAQPEYIVHEVRRIADIAFTFPGGWIVIHEVQLAKITTHDLEARTNDYRDAGYDVVWWLGKSADTESNRKWLLENFGECFRLDYQMASQSNPSRKQL